MAKFKEPKQTVKAYKLFRVDQRQPGKLFPLFVHANQPVDLDTWHEAQIGEMTGDKVKSKIGPLAFRPGWHAGDLPVATHIGEKSDPKLTAPDTRPANHVWAEVEMPDDVDWQSVANERGTNAQGRVVPVKAHITDQIPKGGHYRYKTNSNMTGNWLIGGAMKVNKVLSDKEVRAINKAAGVADLPRAAPFPAKKYGFASGGLVAPDEWKADEHVNYGKGVAHMAGGGDVDQGDPLSNLPPASPQDTTPMDKYKLAIWAEKNNPDMLTANNNELAALLMRSRIGNTTYDDRSEEEPRLEQRRSISPFSSPEQFQNMPGDNIFGMRREMPRPESFDYPRLEKGIDYRKKIQELEDSITRREKRLGIPYKGAYHAHGGRVTHAHHLDIEERPL